MRIMKLTQLVKAKDEEVRRVNEEMKFFKLEVSQTPLERGAFIWRLQLIKTCFTVALQLVNREHNFNKVFARTPNVGLIAPTTSGGVTGGTQQPSSYAGPESSRVSGQGSGGAASRPGVGAAPLAHVASASAASGSGAFVSSSSFAQAVRPATSGTASALSGEDLSGGWGSTDASEPLQHAAAAPLPVAGPAGSALAKASARRSKDSAAAAAAAASAVPASNRITSSQRPS
jgi:hypothetical protein